ncbi:MAG: hypothetical protein WCF23_00230 [Candidatus Nitrosopolaris sp.]
MTEHCPYYYAYWKERGKLYKKYIGKYTLAVERTKHQSNDDHVD